MKERLLAVDFRFTAINQLWKLISGVVLLIVVPIYLSAETQGYWYTFISLAALIYFADMGFSAIVLQFAAHEYAHVDYIDNKIIGEENYIKKLSSLWIFTKKYSIRVAALMAPIILIYGYFVLNKKQSNISWLMPWLGYSLTSIIIFVNGMILAFIEGCNRVGGVQRIRFETSAVTVFLTITSLAYHFELYALPISFLVGAIFCSVLIFIRHGKFLGEMNKAVNGFYYPWWAEIKPLIGKYSLSWISGYFMYSTFTPIAFFYFGAIEAGRVGFSLSICTAIFNVSNIWITTITPKINMLISKKEHKVLNKIFREGLILSTGSFLIFMILIMIGLILFGKKFPFSERMLGLFPLSCLLVGWFMQVFINAFAVYVRAFKEEPLVAYSIFTACYVGVSTLIAARVLAEEYYFIGFLSSYMFGIPWVVLIYLKYRNRGLLA